MLCWTEHAVSEDWGGGLDGDGKWKQNPREVGADGLKHKAVEMLKPVFSPGVGKDAANQLTCSRSVTGCDVAFLGLVKSKLPQLEAVTYKIVNVCF